MWLLSCLCFFDFEFFFAFFVSFCLICSHPSTFHFINTCLSLILRRFFEAFVAKRIQRKEQGPATILLKKTDAVSPEVHEIRY